MIVRPGPVDEKRMSNANQLAILTRLFNGLRKK
jgi:hypothetical protein